MNRAKLLPVWDDINHKLHAELDIIFKALDAAALVEQHEAQEPFGPIVAYASSSEFRRNQLLSKAQYDNCLPKNRVDFDIPLVAVSKCDMCNDNGSVGFPPDDYYPCPKCTPPTLAATQAGDAKVISIGHGATLQRQAKTTGAVGWLMYNEHGLVRSLDVFETQLVESALAAMSPTTTRSE
jgi:hypothetical protein